MIEGGDTPVVPDAVTVTTVAKFVRVTGDN